jgi:hypothetical protein
LKLEACSRVSPIQLFASFAYFVGRTASRREQRQVGLTELLVEPARQIGSLEQIMMLVQSLERSRIVELYLSQQVCAGGVVNFPVPGASNR